MDIDPVEGALGLDQWRQQSQQYADLSRLLTVDDANNLTAFLRANPTASPDLAASVAYGGTRWDDPTLTQVIAADNRRQGALQQGLTGMIGWATRPILATAESLYQWGTSKPYNVVTRLVQGQSLETAIAESGRSPWAMAILAERTGNAGEGGVPLLRTLGEGILPGRPSNPLMYEGAGQHLQGLMDEGVPIEEAITATEMWVLDKYGWDVMKRSFESNETTMIHRTINGESMSYHATPGRLWVEPLVAMNLIRPNTAPYIALSGGIDVFHQVALDPIDPAFMELTKYARNRRIAVSDLIAGDLSPDEIARRIGGIRIDDAVSGMERRTRASGLDTGTRVDGLVFHGGGPLEDEILQHGGIASDPLLAQQYADQTTLILPDGQDGLVHVIKVEDLSPEMQAIVRNSDTGTIEQYFSRQALVEQYPEIPVEELLERQRSFLEAARVDEDLSVELFHMIPDPAERAELLAMIDVELTLKHGVERMWIGPEPSGSVIDPDMDILTIGQAKEYYLHTMGDLEGTEAQELVALLDQLMEYREILMYDEVFGVARQQQHAAEQFTRYHLDDPDDIMWGAEMYQPKVSGSYTVDEFQEMMESGHVFPERAQFERWRALQEEEAKVLERSRGRFWITPQTWKKFKARKSLPGTQNDAEILMEWTAKSGSVDIAGMYPGMSRADVEALADLGMDDLDEIEGIISRYWGSPESGGRMPTASRRMRAARTIEGTFKHPDDALMHLSDADGAAGAMSYSPSKPERMYRWAARQFAAMGDNKIDPTDWRGTMELVRSYGETLGASWDEIEATGRKALEMNGSRDSAKPIMRDLFGWIERKLIDEGYTSTEVRTIMDKWSEALERQYRYSAGPGGTEMPNYYGSKIEIKTDYGKIQYPVQDPVLMSQLASRNLFMPDLRQIRRATARLRKATDLDIGSLSRRARGKELPGLATSKPQHAVDIAIASWRNLALLRGGWPLRILPDEMARYWMYGYSEIFTSPVDIILMSMGAKGDVLIDETSLRSIIDIQGLGADNGMFRTVLGDEADLARSATNMRSANWHVTGKVIAEERPDGTLVLTREAQKGIAREVLQLHTDPLLQALAEHVTIEDTIRYLRTPGKGEDTIRALRRLADPDSTLGRAVSFDHPERHDALRAALERIDAMRHQAAGGSWIARNPNGTGWIDNAGNQVPLYLDREHTVEWLTNEIARRGITGPRGGQVSGNLDTLRKVLYEADGTPLDINKLPEAQKYVVTRQGNPELLNLITNGRIQETPNINRARSVAARDMFRARTDNASRGDYVFALIDEEGTNIDEVRAYYDIDAAALKMRPGQSIVPVPKEQLDARAFLDGTDRYVTITRGEAKVRNNPVIGHAALEDYARKLVDDGSVQYIRQDMQVGDFLALEDKLSTSYTTANPPPGWVRYPDKPYLEEDEIGIVDELFKALGRDPSMYVNRLPFATQNTWDNTAQMYIFADPGTRAELLKRAEDANVLPMFERYIKRALEERGMKRPVVGATLMSPDEVLSLAANQAIANTKDLFYDLTKGGQWQDAMRLVFPFADAWWEIISRWAKLANPVTQGGQPLRALRRMQQATDGAEQSGYFDTDTQGRRVFNMPLSAAAWFNWNENINPNLEMMPQVSPEQFLFVDFSNPIEIGVPGFSPQAQVLASAVRPLLPTEWRKVMDQVVFGDFGAPQIDSLGDMQEIFMPTWMRRTLVRAFEGEFDERYASMMVRLMNVMAQTPEYSDVATNRSTAVRLQQDAQTMATWIATADILGSFLAPAQASNRVGLVKMNVDGMEKAKDIGALYGDWAILKAAYGEDEALRVMYEWYDVDPLRMSSTNWTVTPYPVTREAYDVLQEHPTMGDHMPYTLTAWLPEVDGDPFYGEAWNEAKSTGAVETIGPREATALMSHRAGSYRLRKLRELRDEQLLLLEKQLGGRNNETYRTYRDDILKPWYDQEVYSLDLQYWGYGANSAPTGLTARPSFKEVLGELRQIADPYSPAYDLARAADPALHSFVEYTISMWETLDQQTIDAGYSYKWWNTSEARSGEAQRVREAFVHNVRWMLGTLPESSRVKAEWITSTIYEPLLSGFDIENPIVIAPNEPPPITEAFAGGNI